MAEHWYTDSTGHFQYGKEEVEEYFKLAGLRYHIETEHGGIFFSDHYLKQWDLKGSIQIWRESALDNITEDYCYYLLKEYPILQRVGNDQIIIYCFKKCAHLAALVRHAIWYYLAEQDLNSNHSPGVWDEIYKHVSSCDQKESGQSIAEQLGRCVLVDY